MTASKAGNEHYDRGGSAKLVADYDLYREGDLEPHLGKKINALVYKTKTFIVYLDEDLYVEWAFTSEHGEPSREAGQVLNRVSELQALPVSHLSRDQITSFRMLIAEGVARILSEKDDLAAAYDALDKAYKTLMARNAEISRWWYLSASSLSAIVLALVTFGLWLAREVVRPWVGEPVFDIAMGAGAGAVGAFFSVLLGSKNVPTEPGATKQFHYFQGVARIVGGTIGAAFVALAIKAQFLLGQLGGTVNSPELFMLLCMVAGSSERLVPNLIERIEINAAARPEGRAAATKDKSRRTPRDS